MTSTLEQSEITQATRLLLQTPGKMISREEFNSLPRLDKEAIVEDMNKNLALETERSRELYSPIPFYAQRAEKDGPSYWRELAQGAPATWSRISIK